MSRTKETINLEEQQAEEEVTQLSFEEIAKRNELIQYAYDADRDELGNERFKKLLWDFTKHVSNGDNGTLATMAEAILKG